MRFLRPPVATAGTRPLHQSSTSLFWACHARRASMYCARFLAGNIMRGKPSSAAASMSCFGSEGPTMVTLYPRLRAARAMFRSMTSPPPISPLLVAIYSSFFIVLLLEQFTRGRGYCSSTEPSRFPGYVRTRRSNKRCALCSRHRETTCRGRGYKVNILYALWAFWAASTWLSASSASRTSIRSSKPSILASSWPVPKRCSRSSNNTRRARPHAIAHGQV